MSRTKSSVLLINIQNSPVKLQSGLIQAVGILSEFGSARALDLSEEVESATCNSLALVDALPRVTQLVATQHELLWTKEAFEQKWYTQRC